jgi:hypothetical protein
VAYLNRLEPGQWPVLVEISVEVATPGGGDEPVRMRTAVIPGRIGPLVAAAATPTPLPAAGLDEAQIPGATAAPVSASDPATDTLPAAAIEASLTETQP